MYYCDSSDSYRNAQKSSVELLKDKMHLDEARLAALDDVPQNVVIYICMGKCVYNAFNSPSELYFSDFSDTRAEGCNLVCVHKSIILIFLTVTESPRESPLGFQQRLWV